MPASTYSLRTIQNTLGGFSSTPGCSSSPSSSSNFLMGLMHKNPPGLSIGARRGNAYKQSEASRRTQRPSIRLPYNSRRVPPPPPPKVSPSHYAAEDPFSDPNAFDPTRTIIYDSQFSSRSRRSSISNNQNHHAMETNVPRQIALAPDAEARSKLVAGILLHRVHAVGKPMRRVPLAREGPKEYVRSGLSVTITMDC
jgi:hypothetical protein